MSKNCALITLIIYQGQGFIHMELFDKIQESVKAIKGRWNGNPKVGIILGTGLGGFAQEIKQELARGSH